MQATERFWALTHEKSIRPELALEVFDQLEVAELSLLTGRWHGSELKTGNPMEGKLEASGWYGKEFLNPEDVHPLLFKAKDSSIFPGNPIQVIKSGNLEPADGTKARIRMVEYRGKVSTAMIYDDLPIYDHFRKVDDQTVFGIMDLKGLKAPYFFYLQKD